MSKKNFMYLLIIGISIVNFFSAMEETESNRVERIAKERIAQSLSISFSELEQLLLDPQEQGIVSIVYKK